MMKRSKRTSRNKKVNILSAIKTHILKICNLKSICKVKSEKSQRGQTSIQSGLTKDSRIRVSELTSSSTQSILSIEASRLSKKPSPRKKKKAPEQLQIVVRSQVQAVAHLNQSLSRLKARSLDQKTLLSRTKRRRRRKNNLMMRLKSCSF